MKIISGNSNLSLSQNVAAFLDIPLTKAAIQRFSDKEIFVEILENVRGEDVFIIQSTSFPANDNLMELLITIDALRRGSARRITAVIPYFGYGRQDRKTAPRTPISAKLVANLLTTAGADRILTFDLHAEQIQGFFDIPVDNLFASPLFSQDIAERYGVSSPMIVAPDVGSVVRSRSIAKRLNTDLAIIDKRRERPGQSEVMNVIGSVFGRHCILIDDIIDSGGTLCQGAQALQDLGALSVTAYVTHGVLSGQAFENLHGSCLKNLYITNSIQNQQNIEKKHKINYLSIAPLLGQAITHIHEEKSISCLFL
jgi:ribose-phosphate pyrophosphokinase